MIMKHKYLLSRIGLLSLSLLIIFGACRKSTPAQYSTWVVNNDTFSTNEVSVDQGKATLHFFTSDIYAHKPGFYFVFNLGSFVVYDSLKLDCSLQDPSWVCLDIMYDDTGYIAHGTHPEYIQSTLVNGKARYTLQPTWFYNSYRPAEDKILVSGVFNEP